MDDVRYATGVSEVLTAMPTIQETCERLRALLPRVSSDGFQQDFNQLVSGRGQELWIVGIDTPNTKYIDLCGNIGDAALAALLGAGFTDGDAGFRANVERFMPLGDRKADVFLLNKEHFGMVDRRLIPLVAHELAHFFDQLKLAATPTNEDVENGRTILDGLDRPHVIRLHSKEWSEHLASAARQMVKGRKAPQTRIVEFLEVAIPDYDRPHWEPRRIKE